MLTFKSEIWIDQYSELKKDFSYNHILRICYSTSCRKDFRYVWSIS